MRRGDLAASRHDRESDPAFSAQLGKSFDAAAGARMIWSAHDLKPLGKDPFIVEIARTVLIVTQPDRRFTAPDQVADFGAGRGAQGKIDLRILAREVLHDCRQLTTRE